MSYLISGKLWLVAQIGLDLVLIALFVVLIRHFRRTTTPPTEPSRALDTTQIESVLQDAKHVAAEFEDQLREKKAIITRLNEQLDNRIINLNLLLSRADSCPQSLNEGKDRPEKVQKNTYDLQNEIVALSENGLPRTQIAQKLGVIQGEVDLVLDLKKKFQQLKTGTAQI